MLSIGTLRSEPFLYIILLFGLITSSLLSFTESENSAVTIQSCDPWQGTQLLPKPVSTPPTITLDPATRLASLLESVGFYTWTRWTRLGYSDVKSPMRTPNESNWVTLPGIQLDPSQTRQLEYTYRVRLVLLLVFFLLVPQKNLCNDISLYPLLPAY